ncbi:hypothetical protein EAF04_003696 [Stromatinia cepivora]|nr:hypothetical protein EAF04_003696 [Stromatinia cepivora]
MLKGQAKSHRTIFGEPEIRKKFRRSVDLAYCGSSKGYPIAIFKFQHGSKEDLKSLGVIERSPEPEPETEPEFCFGPDPESVLKPISEPQASQMLLWDAMVKRDLLQKSSHAGSTSNTPVDTFVPPPFKQEVQRLTVEIPPQQLLLYPLSLLITYRQ